MATIKVLPETLINKIAAGEVVERPASVVKELIENSIDAGADEIIIDLINGGRRLIRVSDNGSGMSKYDALLSFERHATSKIYEEEDLNKIATLGFRGEALPSIASVSKVVMLTSSGDSVSGVKIEIEGARLKKVSEASSPKGTVIEVREIFFNTPARLRFLKGLNTELSHIVGIVEEESLSHLEISFLLTHNKRVILSLPKAKGPLERIHQIYGGDLIENLIEVRKDMEGIRLMGYISNPGYSRPDRGYQFVFINRRPVKNPVVSHAIREAYQGLLMRDQYPAAFISIDMDTRKVDVNVHPTKREIRFRDPSEVHDLIVITFREALSRKVTEGYIEESRESVIAGVKEAVERYFSAKEMGIRNEKGLLLHPTLPLKLDTTLEANYLQAYETFIITVGKDGITIVDQHAAHERILYEKLKAEGIEIQTIIPERVELSFKESIKLRDKLELLKASGIEIEEFGGNTFLIRSMPALLRVVESKRLLLDILGELEGEQGIDEIERVRIIMACHGAVKANQPLTQQEMARLVKELSETTMPQSCPHGRPTSVKLELKDLEKLFRRRR